MDQARYDELIAKRDGEEGLSDEEANELGRLEAEAEGMAYEGHGPNAAEADAEGAMSGQVKPHSADPVENEGLAYQDDVITREVEDRLSG
jgi:hypothetical protein